MKTHSQRCMTIQGSIQRIHLAIGRTGALIISTEIRKTAKPLQAVSTAEGVCVQTITFQNAMCTTTVHTTSCMEMNFGSSVHGMTTEVMFGITQGSSIANTLYDKGLHIARVLTSCIREITTSIKIPLTTTTPIGLKMYMVSTTTTNTTTTKAEESVAR